MRVDRHGLSVGLLFVLIGLTCGYMSAGYRLGSLQRMGPGYFPLMVSVCLGGLGALLMLKAVLQPGDGGKAWRWNLRPMLAVCGGTAIFALTLKPLGMAIAMILLIVIATFGNPNRETKVTVLSLAFLLPVSWFIFIYLLRLPMTVLPKGWGF